MRPFPLISFGSVSARKNRTAREFPGRARHAARRLTGALAAAGMAAALGTLVLATGPEQPPAGQQPPTGAQGQPQAARQPPAQGQTNAAQQPPTFRTEANFVRVDVYPTAGGKPVQDLRQDEFQVFEDGVAQKVQTFEHIVVRSASPEDVRVEPNTVREANDMAANSNARLFVLFLDTYHISLAGAANARKALVTLLNRAVGPDDMIAVMTPEMSAAAVTFSRRTGTIDELLGKYWDWSRRQRLTSYDPIEEQYMMCYPPSGGEGATSAIAREMIDRRRERLTLEALEDLVVHLGGLREERKAVVAVSEGWLVYRRNSNLARPVNGAPGAPPVGTGPDGRLRVGDLGNSVASNYRCEQDRAQLAQEDHDRQFRDMLDDANRANVSFYPVDPRGLPVFDTPIGPDTQVSPAEDAANLTTRIESLRTLAVATDGIAIVNSNDIEKGVRRVVDDLTSYYLLGYYSTNTKLDGKFRSISVRVTRPKVDVRARRGYRAATREEVNAREKAAAAAGTAGATPISNALAALSKIRPEAFVQTRAGYDWRMGGSGALQPAIWIAGELDPSAASRDESWKAGADVAVTVTAMDKTVVEETHETLAPASRAFLVHVPATGGLPPGDYTVRVTSKPVGTPLGSTETLHVFVPKAPSGDSPATGQPLLYRRGPFSGPTWLPAADLRFRRQERVRVEVPVSGAFSSSEVRLLDRAGNPLNVPVTSSVREGNGGKVITGEVTLAPLGLGEYVLETDITQGTATQKVLAVFKIVP